MHAYTFTELVTLSGISRNAAKHLVQSGTIRPAIKATVGPGDHRTFGFLDVFEACVAERLTHLASGLPTAVVEAALNAVRAEPASSTTGERQPSGWDLFVDPQTRDPSTQFWLATYRADDITDDHGKALATVNMFQVVDRQGRDQLLDTSADALVLLRLDSLLLGLERRTQDHATAHERAVGQSGSSTQDLIEAAIARELTTAGLSDEQIESVFARLHQKLAKHRPELFARETFVTYVEMIEAIAKINGKGPNYDRWRKEVDTFSKSWDTKKRAPMDASILHILSGVAAAERALGTPRTDPARA